MVLNESIFSPSAFEQECCKTVRKGESPLSETQGRKKKVLGDDCPVSQNFLLPSEQPQDPWIEQLARQSSTLRQENGAGAAAPRLPPVGCAGAAVWLIQHWVFSGGLICPV